MKILILGAKGNLGIQLVKIFIPNNKVIAWDREEIDITDKILVINKINDVKPDVIINAAAYNAVDKCEESDSAFESAKKLNGKAVGYLAEAALKVGAILVHYSTDYVFGRVAKFMGDERMNQIKERGGFKEDDRPHPINKYAETKLRGERELLKRSSRGLKWYLIRTSKLFGPKGESEIAKPSFFDIMLKLANEREFKANLANKRECSANVANDIGDIDVVDEEMSCFAYTPDLARATRELIESKKEFGIYHITNNGACTWHGAAQELFKIAKIGIKINPISSEELLRPAERPKYSVLLNTKFDQLRDWREALREYLQSN